MYVFNEPFMHILIQHLKQQKAEYSPKLYDFFVSVH